ncbi:MAG: hypothetical protein U0270_44365 [Labilithrix sp.]
MRCRSDISPARSSRSRRVSSIASPVIELDDKQIALHLVDPVGNAKRPRPPRRPAPERAKGPVNFNPGRTLQEEDGDDDIF